MDQTRIFSRFGDWTHQIDAPVDRGYGLVQETSAVFPISVYDDKCRDDVLGYNDILLVENSDGLPPFCGPIDKREFNNGAAIITAYTPERFFAQRRGPQKMLLKGSAAEIFAQMIQYINAEEDTVLEVGNLSSDSGYMEETLTPTMLNYNLARIVARSGEGYRWRPVVNNGQLKIYCDWTTDLVIESGLILHDGYNVSGDHPLSETPPVNDVLIYGNGTDWAKRKTATATDAESRQRYGLRQYSQNMQTDSQSTLNLAAATYLRQKKSPKTNFPLTALNVGDTFSKLEPGALATITKFVGQGFSRDGLGYSSGSIIIRSMSYSPRSGEVALSV